MSSNLETTREIVAESAANLDKFYTPDAGDRLRLVLDTIDDAVAERELWDALAAEHDNMTSDAIEEATESRQALRHVVEIIDSAKIDDFKAAKAGRDEAVKVLHEIREFAANSLHGDGDE